jgi:hypothetical protein
MRRILVLLLACGVAAAVPVSSHAASAKLPDLRVVDAGILTPTLHAGQRSVVKVTVRNAGKATSGATTVTFSLSADAKLGRDLPLVGAVKVPALKPGMSKDLTGSVTMGRRVKVGGYRVFACVDAARRVAESSDRNNCPAGERVGVQPRAHETTVAPTAVPGVAPATATIGINGGRIDLVTPDGTTYSLFIPSRALQVTTTITMTPLASLGGLPYAAGLGGGVLLEPSGLDFARPATLAVSGAGVDASANLARFSFEGSGADFHAIPGWQVVPDSAQPGFDPAHTVYLAVQHFSGVGFAPATSNEEAVQDVKRAVQSRHDLEREAADATKDGKLDAAKLEAYYAAYMDQVLLPEAAAAAYSDGLYLQAVRDYIGWIRSQQMTGTSPDSSSGLAGFSLDGHWKSRNAEFNRLMDLAWKQVLVRLEADCRGGRFDTLGRIVDLERERQLIGVGDDPTPNQFSEILRRCMHFELAVTSDATRSIDQDSQSVHYHWRLEARVPIEFTGDATTFDIASAHMTGSAAFAYTVREFTEHAVAPGAASCTFTWGGDTTAGLLTVLDSSLRWSPGSKTRPSFRLQVDPGNPSELIHGECTDTGAADELRQVFLEQWKLHHGSWSATGDAVGGSGDTGPWSAELQPGTYPVVGTLQIADSNASYGTTFTESWTLTHKPLPAPKR